MFIVLFKFQANQHILDNTTPNKKDDFCQSRMLRISSSNTRDENHLTYWN